MLRWITALALAQTATAQPPLPSSLFTAEKELALGRGLAADLRRQSPPVQDAALSAYLSALTGRLNQHAGSAFPLSIEVTRHTREREVTSLPGGFLLVPLGALLAADSEAQLAGVMAHGLAHLVARHGVRQVVRGQSEGLATIPLIFFGHGHVSAHGDLLIPRGFVPLQREMELEADRLAARWMNQAGYAPAAYAAYVERLAVPEAAERLATIQEAGAPTRPMAPDAEFQRIKERAEALGKALSPAVRQTTTPPTLRRSRGGAL